jgi:hypothetical protein
MDTTDEQVGRVIRVGRGWVDVTVERKMRRVSTRPDLLIRVGSYLKIVNDQGVVLLPADHTHFTRHVL